MAGNYTVVPQTAETDDEYITKDDDGKLTAGNQLIQDFGEHEIEIIELQANASVTPIDHESTMSDTFSDADGYNDSVNTTNTTATFSTNKYAKQNDTLSTYSYSGDTIDTQDSIPYGLFFSADGTKLYECGTSGSPTVYQSTLSTPWEISTATYDSTTLTLGGDSIKDIFIKPDGTKLYALAYGGDVRTYDLSTAWDIGSGNLSSTDDISISPVTNPNGFTFKPDGTKLYVVCRDTDKIYQFSLTTAWDLSTMSYDGFSVNTDTSPQSLNISSDGMKLLYTRAANIYQVCLGIAYDLSSYVNTQSMDNQSASSSQACCYGDSDTKIYEIESYDDNIYQFEGNPTVQSKMIEIDLPAISGTVTATQLIVNEVDIHSLSHEITYDIIDDSSNEQTGLNLQEMNDITTLTGNPVKLKINMISGFFSIKSFCLKVWK